MDENMIFRPIEEPKNESGVIPEIPIDQFTPPPDNLPSSPPPLLLVKIIKIIVGIVIVIAAIFVIFNIILPRFFPAQFTGATITYWGVFDDPKVLAPIIADFQKENPKIKIEYVKQDIDQYKDKLITRSNNGNGPDVFLFHNSWVPQISTILLPIPINIITQEDFDKNYYPVAKTDLVRNGIIYGLPQEIDILALYVNKTMFQAAGLNAPAGWTELSRDARQLTVKDDKGNIKTAGVAMGTFNNVTHAPDIISMLFAQNGVDLNNLESNRKAVADALTWYTGLAKAPDNVWDENMDQSIKAFASGSLAMYFGYARDYSVIKSMNPDLAFDIFEVPKLIPGQGMTIASYWVNGASSKSMHPKEALQFLRYLSSKLVSQRLFDEQSKLRNFGDPYARLDLADSLNGSIIYPFVSNAPSAISSYFIDGTYDNGLNTQSNEKLGEAVSSLLGDSSPDLAVDNFLKGLAPILKQYGL